MLSAILLLEGCNSTYVGSLGEYQKICDSHTVVTCTADIRSSNKGVEAQIFFYRAGPFSKYYKNIGLLNLTPAELDRVLTALEVK